MTSNPFAPPLAPVEDPTDDPAATPRRPISVWTFQAVAALCVCGVGVWTAAVFWRLPPAVFQQAGIAAGLAVDTALLVVLVATVVGCQRRAAFARWTGLGCIALVFGLLAWADAFMLQVPSTSQDEDSRLGGDVVILAMGALVLAPTAFWFWAYGFSAKSRAWFGARRARAPAAP